MLDLQVMEWWSGILEGLHPDKGKVTGFDDDSPIWSSGNWNGGLGPGCRSEPSFEIWVLGGRSGTGGSVWAPGGPLGLDPNKGLDNRFEDLAQ